MLLYVPVPSESSLVAKQRLHVTMSLTNNCRLHTPDADFTLLCYAVLELSLDTEQQLLVLLRLANKCELQASDADFSLREKAAGLRQELLVEMVNQEKEVSRKYAACQEVINAHNPSQPHQGDDDMKILVAPCCHLYHKRCLKALVEAEGCAECASGLGLSARTLQ